MGVTSFIHSFTHSLKNHSLSTYVSGTVLISEDIAANKIGNIPDFKSFVF